MTGPEMTTTESISPQTIGTETIADYLGRLAARRPTPGGGAAGALHAAQAAALVAMVARYTTGPRYAEHEAEATQIGDRADELRGHALALADTDEVAFQSVITAYGLPKESPADSELRTQAIQDALVAAARPPQDLITLAGAVVELGARLAVFGNPQVISDVAAAAEAARAAAATGRVNIDINLTGLKDGSARAALESSLDEAETVITATGVLADQVRKQIRS